MAWITSLIIVVCTYWITVSGVPRNGDLRLVHGTQPWEGRLEIYHKDRWGVICDDQFNSNAAKVACKKLGFFPGKPKAHTASHFGHKSDNIRYWLDDLSCTGHEATLDECSHTSWGANDCRSTEHAGVTCNPTACGKHWHRCLHGSTCTDVGHSFKCNCPPNYKGQTCADVVDWCLAGTDECSHICVNNGGSYTCKCPHPELSLSADNHTCFAPGEKVTCTSDSMQIDFVRSRFPGLREEFLSLKNSSCKATGNATHITLKTSLAGCGTEQKAVPGKFIYNNQVLSHEEIVGGLISRTREIDVKFRCVYSQTLEINTTFIDDTGPVQFSLSGYGELDVRFDVFADRSIIERKDATMINPGQTINVNLRSDLNSSIKVVAENCVANRKHTLDKHDSVHSIIRNRCGNDSTLSFLSSESETMEAFSIEAFKFHDDAPDVYIHCDVLLCHMPSDDCTKVCQQTTTSNDFQRREIRTKRSSLIRDESRDVHDNYLILTAEIKKAKMILIAGIASMGTAMLTMLYAAIVVNVSHTKKLNDI